MAEDSELNNQDSAEVKSIIKDVLVHSEIALETLS